MLRSLWAGVSGLQAHQIALDTEANNIANVNTAGFKYSRANFSDLLSQTSKIATAPQGALGGKNPMQVGLGTQVGSITKIFKQGSVQVTDKNTDLAIQGDGFFVVSPDGGATYKYTRNGNFNFDALGNFTDDNGYIIQGWMRDPATNRIDSTTPIQNITIPPGLTTPANDTSFISLKANLNSGSSITKKSAIYSLDANHGWYDANNNHLQDSTEVNHDENGLGTPDAMFDANRKMIERGEDFKALFNSSGKSFSLSDGQGAWISYTDSKYVSGTVSSTATTKTVDLTINGVPITGSITQSTSTVASDIKKDNMIGLQGLINQFSTTTGVSATVSSGALTLTNTNQAGTETSSKNIKVVAGSTDQTGFITAGSTIDVITAFKYTYTSNAASEATSRTDARKFHTTEDLRNAMQTDARLKTDYLGNGFSTNANVDANKNDGAQILINNLGEFEVTNPKGDALNANDGDVVTVNNPATGTPWDLTTANLITGGALNVDTSFPPTSVLASGTDTITLSGPAIIPIGTTFTLNGTPSSPNPSTSVTSLVAGDVLTAVTLGATALTLPAGTTFSNTATTVGIGTNTLAKNDQNINLAITGYSDATNKVSENTVFATTMKTLQGALPAGNNVRTSQAIYAASHASSIDVFDSLGSKHTVRLEFRKVGTTTDGGTKWNMIVSVPQPGIINDTGFPDNIITGQITFGSDGSISSYSPPTLRYTPNNGATPNQSISLNFGTAGQFDGMTSYDASSKTSNISQDGFSGGDLAGIRVDETGTLIGSFTNGRSFGLAQVSMAKFTNNNALESDGGNTFIQTSNSGNPLIGQAAVGGRGFIQASALEMSNVDLSHSLTQLIIDQRGFQANAKTITTSDQILNTLLQLKQ
jgi:flagellar hook protein FlgE